MIARVPRRDAQGPRLVPIDSYPRSLYTSAMRVILTGVTGMVGEGVLLECLDNPTVTKVLSVSRKPTNHTHPKLEQLLVSDFRNLSDVEAKLTGYDACFYC